MPKINNDWLPIMGAEYEKNYYMKMKTFLKNEYASRTIYPNADDIFNAYHFTPYSKVKVLILGQDPYHGENQAHGLCFSVKKGIQIPPSLRNIYVEIEMELGVKMPNHGYLKKWCDEGVFLLNTVLTVRAGIPNSHRGIGWEIFTDETIKAVNSIEKPIVIMLWGRNADAKSPLLNNPKHLVLRAPHPSPLSAHRGFFKCGHFKICNDFLIKNGESPIDWSLPHNI